MPTISLFERITQVTNGKEIDIDIFLDGIQNGKWQDDVFAVNNGKKEKSTIPYVTCSGLFAKHRSITGLTKHSGFLCMDIDDVDDPDEVKSRVCVDKYVYACFTSLSGKGLAILFKVNPDKHAEAFDGLQEYLFSNYEIISDPSCKDVCRPRYISFDPGIYINKDAVKFTEYPKRKAPTKIPTTIFAQSDFDELIREIDRRGLNLCESYHDWLRIGFAIAEKFGENGRSYFHVLSSPSGKYSSSITDRQYTNCLKARGAKISTIATFYYYCKQAGMNLYSNKTKTIINAAVNAKKGGRTREQAVQVLANFEGVPPEETESLVEQVFDSAIDASLEESIQTQVEMYLKHEHQLKRNAITRYIEDNGKPLMQQDMNTIWTQMQKVIEKVSYERVERTINSNTTPTFNPIHDFFTRHEADQKRIGLIDSICDCIHTEDHEFTRYFMRKWLVSVIASAYGQHSVLMFVLSGKVQGTGKTEYWRRFMPKELMAYYAESKLDAGKDDEILMTQKLIIMDDEMSGKSKKDEKNMKSLSSKQVFSLREPYGRNNVDLQRIAVLCGTTNEEAIISDPTGNRRIIPIPVFSIDHDMYNSIDKTDMFMEAYWLYKSGFDFRLSKEDVKRLNDASNRFEKYSMEYELIARYISPAEENEPCEKMTCTDIKSYLENISGQKNLSIVRLGQELNGKLGYKQKHIKNGTYSTMRVYFVNKKMLDTHADVTGIKHFPEIPTQLDIDLPFN